MAVLRFGVIGLGRASVGMIPALAQHPRTKLVAAADIRPEPLKKFAQEFGAETYARAEELCKSPHVDAVYISSPHQYHAEHAIAAAQQGKHIIVEKPMALTLEECDRMVGAAERHGVKLIVGHTASYNPAVKQMRRLVAGGELGRLGLINVSAYTNFLYRVRRQEELDTSQGGGIIFNQVPHQVDSVRLVGGGMVRSVRAATWIWDERRPTEGLYAAFLDFEDPSTGSGRAGPVAVLTYNGYDHFDSTDYRTWIDQGQARPAPQVHGQARQMIRELGGPEGELARLAEWGYGGAGRGGLREGGPSTWQGELGNMIVSCEHGDIRLAADGLVLFTDEGKREMPVTRPGGIPGRADVIDELYGAVFDGRPLVHHGPWAKATLAVCLAVLESAKLRREVPVGHQVPTVDEGL